jgi:hypothetical protein
MGSASELGYHVLLAHDPGFLDRSVHTGSTNDVIEVKCMLAALIETLTADG